jgi:anaerobic magnesium-protoporphyrin IX monomethyl ester cyclase
MKISLIFPPPFDLTQPYLSVPTLSAYLKQKNYDTVQRDLNIECFDYLISSETLTRVYQRVCDQLDKARFPETVRNESKIHALERAKRICPTLIPICADIKSSFRQDEDFFNHITYSRSMRLLHRVCEVISMAYYPTSLTPISFRMKYKGTSVAQILEAIEDERENLFISPFQDVFVPSLLAEKPDLIGISVVYSDQLIPALTLCRLLKQGASDTKIVIGGDVFSRMSRTNLESLIPFYDFVDAFVVDDGRQPLLSICQRIEEAQPLDGIPRVLTRESDHVSLRPAVFDNFPAPDYGGLATSIYFSPGPIFSLLAGKGCKWGKCTFCTESFTKDYFPKPIPELMQEIDCLVKDFNVTCINFADVDISIDRLSELAEALLAKDYRIVWSSRTRLTKGIDRDFCELIARSGCRKLYFGLESASQRVLNRMRKGILIERVPEMLKACWLSGIAVHFFSFVGFPGETREEARMTMRFLAAHSQYISSFNIGNFYFRTFSDIYIESQKFGVKSIETEEIDADLDNTSYEVEHGMGMKEAEQMSYALTREAYLQISRDDSGFEIYPASRYVKKTGFPAYDSHNLAYLARYPNTWTPENGAGKRSDLNDDTVLAVQPFVELRRESDGTCIVFDPRSARVLRLPTTTIEMLMACDGRTPLRALKARFGAVGSSLAARQLPAEVESNDLAVRAKILATFARAFAEGFLVEVEDA